MVNLYKFKNDRISIQIEAKFDKGDLLIEGYDIGKVVEDAWGDSDYEYCYAINPNEVKQLYKIFGIKEGERSALLHVIKNHFNGNKAYSLFGEFMNENKIEYSSSTWT